MPECLAVDGQIERRRLLCRADIHGGVVCVIRRNRELQRSNGGPCRTRAEIHRQAVAEFGGQVHIGDDLAGDARDVLGLDGVVQRPPPGPAGRVLGCVRGEEVGRAGHRIPKARAGVVGPEGRVVLNREFHALFEGHVVDDVPPVGASARSLDVARPEEGLLELVQSPGVAEIVLRPGADDLVPVATIDPHLLVALAPPALHRAIDVQGHADDAAPARGLQERVVVGRRRRLPPPLGVEVGSVGGEVLHPRPGQLQSDPHRFLALVHELQAGALAEGHLEIQVPLPVDDPRRQGPEVVGLEAGTEQPVERGGYAGDGFVIPSRLQPHLAQRIPLRGVDLDLQRLDDPRAAIHVERIRLPRLQFRVALQDARLREDGLGPLAGSAPGGADLVHGSLLRGRQRQPESGHPPVFGESARPDVVILPPGLVRRDLAAHCIRNRQIAVRGRLSISLLIGDRSFERRDFTPEEFLEVEFILRGLRAVEVKTDLALRIRRPKTHNATGAFHLGHDRFAIRLGANVLPAVAVRIRVLILGAVEAGPLAAGDAILQIGQPIEVDQLAHEGSVIAGDGSGVAESGHGQHQYRACKALAHVRTPPMGSNEGAFRCRLWGDLQSSRGSAPACADLPKICALWTYFLQYM